MRGEFTLVPPIPYTTGTPTTGEEKWETFPVLSSAVALSSKIVLFLSFVFSLIFVNV